MCLFATWQTRRLDVRPFSRFSVTTAPKTQNRARLWKAVPLPNMQTKSGSDLATSGALLTFRSRFDLLLAYPLTLLLIGGLFLCISLKIANFRHQVNSFNNLLYPTL
jgi:hypothetical protein